MWNRVRNFFRCSLIFFMLILYADSHPAAAVESPLALTATFSFPITDTNPLPILRKLAFFEVRKRAVASAAEILMQKGLLKDYGEQAPEIFCLAAKKIRTRILEETILEKEKLYFFRICAEISVIDFMEAEIENQELERLESAFPWKEEMEQPVSASVAPGEELSRAYRYLRQDQTRIAIIYLDHLTAKYPGWGTVYFLRGLGFQRMHSDEQMLDDFKKACSLNQEEACKRLEALK